MSQFKPDDALMGCPLYRRLLPNKWKAQVTEAAFLLVMFGGDFAGGKVVDGVRIGCNFDVVNQTEKPT